MYVAIAYLLLCSYLLLAFYSAAALWCVKGSRARYVFASLAWAALPGAVAHLLLGAVAAAVVDDGPSPVEVVLQAAVVAWCVYLLVREDDDNYWRRKRRRLVRRVRAWVRSLRPVAAAGHAPA